MTKCPLGYRGGYLVQRRKRRLGTMTELETKRSVDYEDVRAAGACEVIRLDGLIYTDEAMEGEPK